MPGSLTEHEASEGLVTEPGSPPAESGGGVAVRGSRLSRRRRVLLGIGIAAALLAGGGLIGASFVKSPQQLAADTAPPPDTVTTAAVVSQVLTSSVQMRGLVYPSTEYDVYASAPASSSGADSGSPSSAGGSSSAGEVYISKLEVAAGDTITNGEHTAGYFGPATEDAVSAYYEHLGYSAPSSGGVPAADVVFLPSLPATVVAVNGAAGEQPGQPFLELAPRGSLALTGQLPPAYAGQVKSGLKVTIYDEVTGIHAAGAVADLGTATLNAPAGTVVDIGGGSGSAGSAGSAGSGSTGSTGSSGSTGSAGSAGSGAAGSSGETPFIPLTVHPSRPLAAALNGENVLVTVDTGQTEGPVLTVPVAAIVTTASGTSYVTVVGAHGKQTDVPVTPGISENGYVQVTPKSSGALVAGDRVVVSG